MTDRCADWFTLADLTSCEADAASAGASGTVAGAMDWMFHATGSRWTGPCESVIRPLVAPCGHAFTPGCGCSRNAWDRIDLTTWLHGPVTSIDSVTVGGTLIDPQYYRLDNARFFTPQASQGDDNPFLPWPDQFVNRPDGDPGTWSITVSHGSGPPASVLDATMYLACQLLRRRSGRECDLPDNATSIARDGVSINFAVPTNGRTGIPSIDTVLDLYAGNRTRRRMHDPLTRVSPVNPAP